MNGDEEKGQLYRSEDGKIVCYYDPELDRTITIHPGDYLCLNFKDDKGPGSVSGLKISLLPEEEAYPIKEKWSWGFLLFPLFMILSFCGGFFLAWLEDILFPLIFGG